MLLFHIFFFCTGYVSASLLTDVTHQKSDQSSITSGIQSVNQSLGKILTNQENLVNLAISRTISIMTSDIADLKRQTKVLEEENADLKRQTKVLEEENIVLKKQDAELKKHFAEMNSSMTKLKKEQEILKDDFSTDMNTLRANISNVRTDFDVKIRNVSVIVSEVKTNNMESTTKMLTAVKDFGIVNDTVQKLKLDILQSQKKQGDINVQSLEFQLNMSKIIPGMRQKVAFTAGMTSTVSSGLSVSTLVFPHVICNTGGGYSPSTGIFTAPIAGTYVFYVAAVGNYDKDIYVDITVNGQSKVRTISENRKSDSHYNTGTNLVTCQLKQGDRVWVKRWSGDSYFTYSAAPLTTFSGFLLHG